MIFSADDTCDVGKEGGALVADDYPVPNDFTGEVEWVEIDVGDAAQDADHMLRARRAAAGGHGPAVTRGAGTTGGRMPTLLAAAPRAWTLAA